MKIFYCAFESIFNPIFDSQIIVLLKKINSRLKLKKHCVNLVVFGSLFDIFKKGYWTKRRIIKNSLNNRVFFTLKFPYLFRFPAFLRFALFLNSMICLMVFLFVFRLKRSESAVLQCRTELGSYIILNIRRKYYKKFKVICDCRGLGSREILYKDGIKNKDTLSKGIDKIEKFVWVNSDFLFCVSKTFKEYILKESNCSLKKIMVVPCCVDINKFKYDSKLRKEIKKKIGINEENFIVLYSGSLNEWQLPERMIEIFKVIEGLIEESLFLIMTKDLRYARELLLDSGIEKESYIIKSIPYSTINKYLLAGDLGLLIREDNDVNKVAFPVKFPEYIRCGVPVLSSISSDVINLIGKYSLGFELEKFDSDEEVKKIAANIKRNMAYIKSDRYKNRISNVVRKKVSWDSYINQVIEVYKNLLLSS